MRTPEHNEALFNGKISGEESGVNVVDMIVSKIQVDGQYKS